jgi:hypothetical protein
MSGNLVVNNDGYVRVSDDRTNTQTEHVRVAEKKLGRKIGKKEVVHHVDETRSNNEPENLMVFRTAGDHTTHHSKISHELFQTQDGSYVAVKVQQFCKFCERPYEPNKFDQVYCDLLCYGKDKAKDIPSSTELKNLVLKMPATQVAKIYGVSDKAIKQWCDKFNIEKPGRGYWTKNTPNI